MSSSLYVTPHFTRAELNYDAAPATARANLEQLAALLERVRSELGVPLRVTSGYRSPATNAGLAGASSSSQHLDGTGADVVPVGLSIGAAAQRLAGSPLRGQWGQLIVYPLGGDHLHIGMATRGKVGEMLVQTSSDAARPVYAPYSPALYAELSNEKRAGTISTVALGVAGLGALTLLSE